MSCPCRRGELNEQMHLYNFWVISFSLNAQRCPEGKFLSMRDMNRSNIVQKYRVEEECIKELVYMLYVRLQI